MAFFIVYVSLAWIVKKLLGKKNDDKDLPEYVTVEKYEKDTKALKKRIESLEDSLAERKASENKIAALSGAVNDQNLSEREVKQEVIEEERPKTLYLSPPSPDGVFHESFSQPRVGSTVYQMTTSDDNHGTFIFYENRDALATAMISISQIVKTVCRVENNKSNPQDITNVSEGKVVKEGNSWRVVEKATVRFK
ncbi:MAG: hypothetical protein IKZ61_12710 [Prevotella sp.]|nr:hypothetical protein [Prevotella sp.]MBR4926586.1 hypothetical protein [Prevotella sp.]